MAPRARTRLVQNNSLAIAPCLWSALAERAGADGARTDVGRNGTFDARQNAVFGRGDMGLSASGLVATRIASGADVGGFVRGNGGVGEGARGQ